MEHSSSGYYDRKGQRLTLLEWAKLFEDFDYAEIKKTPIDKYLVSTIWVGVSYPGAPKGPSKIFKTKIFYIGPFPAWKKKDPLLSYEERHDTEQEALESHDRAIDLIRHKVPIDE